MNKKQDVDWEALRWHKYTDAEIGRLVGRSPTQIARVRRQYDFPAVTKTAKAAKPDPPTARERHASKTVFRHNPDVVIREEKHSSKVCYVVYVDGEVLVGTSGHPILFYSITRVRETKAAILEDAKNGEKATTSTCWTLAKGSNGSAHAKRLRL